MEYPSPTASSEGAVLVSASAANDGGEALAVDAFASSGRTEEAEPRGREDVGAGSEGGVEVSRDAPPC